MCNIVNFSFIILVHLPHLVLFKIMCLIMLSVNHFFFCYFLVKSLASSEQTPPLSSPVNSGVSLSNNSFRRRLQHSLRTSLESIKKSSEGQGDEVVMKHLNDL